MSALSAPSAAATYSYVINADSWGTESSPFECRLISVLPYHGQAVFRKGAGEGTEEFYLDVPPGNWAGGPAQMRAEAPLWRPAAGTVALGEVESEAAAQPVRLGQRETTRLLAELHQGREVVFEVNSSSEGADGARLALTSIGFRRAYEEYQGCLASLLPTNFNQIRRTAIYFPPGETEELPQEQVDKLEQILRYAQADRYLKEIYIDGHTDSMGTREANLQLSEHRAHLVTEYLVKRGMPEDRIVTRWHGERYPVERNDSANKRAQNRRVTIRLERVEPVTIPSLAASAQGSGS